MVFLRILLPIVSIQIGTEIAHALFCVQNAFRMADSKDHTSYNIVTVIGTAASRVYFHLKAEAVRMGE